MPMDHSGILQAFEERWKKHRKFPNTVARPDVAELCRPLIEAGAREPLRELLELEMWYRLEVGEQGGLAARYAHLLAGLLSWEDVQELEKEVRRKFAEQQEFEQMRRLSPQRDMPKQFGKYELVRPLGQGGMGCVWLAKETSTGQHVALKVPLLTGSEHLERFNREARLACEFRHHGFCPVIDNGEVAGRPYLVMEYIEGKPLDEVLRSEKVLPVERAVAIAYRVARAMHALHKAGLIHRDLKPANIIMRRGDEDEPVVVDFGLARSIDGRDRITESSQKLGTPAYMAPEQFVSSMQLGPSCDIWSLGVILYELLTGRLPFDQSFYAAVMFGLAPALPRVTPPSQHRAGLDKALDRICLKALARDLGQRHASMEAFAAELDHYLQAPLMTRGLPLAHVRDQVIRDPLNFALRKHYLALRTAALRQADYWRCVRQLLLSDLLPGIKFAGRFAILPGLIGILSIVVRLCDHTRPPRDSFLEFLRDLVCCLLLIFFATMIPLFLPAFLGVFLGALQLSALGPLPYEEVAKGSTIDHIRRKYLGEKYLGE